MKQKNIAEETGTFAKSKNCSCPFADAEKISAVEVENDNRKIIGSQHWIAAEI